MMMSRSIPIVILLILLIGPVSAQCIGAPEPSVMGGDWVVVSSPEVWATDRFVNGSLMVDDRLTVISSDIVLGGAGIQVTSNGSLSFKGGRISPKPGNSGFFIENSGNVDLQGVVVEGCSDPDSPLTGIYQLDGILWLNGTSMISSGMVRSSGGSTSIAGSTISGIASFGGTTSITGSEVTSFGISLLGNGTMSVKGTSVTSSIPFSSPVSAVSCLDGGSLEVEDVAINGSYDGGIYSRNARISVSNVHMDLEGGLYGLRAENTTMAFVYGLSVNGTAEGLTMLGSTDDALIEECRVMANFSGLLWSGEHTARVSGSSFLGSTYGVVARGPVSLNYCDLMDNHIGVLVERGRLEARGNRVIGFSRWGIEEETWSASYHEGNTIQGSTGSRGDYAWWGRVNVAVISDHGAPIGGAEVEMSTADDTINRISQGEVGMVWGYSNRPGPSELTIVEVFVRARWGTSSSSMTFRPFYDRNITLMLNMSDLKVTRIERVGDEVEVTVHLSGPEVRDAQLVLYAEGEGGNISQKENFQLSSGAERNFSFSLKGLKEGDYRLTARISSRDEYNGDGELLRNNERGMDLRLEDGGGDGPSLAIGALILVFASIALVLANLLWRRT